jgi:hypothetical protein
MLKFICGAVVFGWAVVWAQERELARAAAENRTRVVFEYRDVAACVDDRYINLNDSLDNATWICELRFLGRPR